MRLRQASFFAILITDRDFFANLSEASESAGIGKVEAKSLAAFLFDLPTRPV